MNMREAVQQIIKLAREFGLFTKSDTSEKVARRFEAEGGSVQVVLTSGEPTKTMQCSRCNEVLKASEFSYYQTRIDAEGYLMRGNALCRLCRNKSNKARQKVLGKQASAPKPEPGDQCPNCNREWWGNWHRHHDPATEQFVAWWCGNCNMARQDQRNPNVYKSGDKNG